MNLKKNVSFFLLIFVSGVIVAQAQPNKVLDSSKAAQQVKEKVSKKQIRDNVYLLISETLGVEKKNLTDTKRFADDLDADDYAFLEFIFALEDEYDTIITTGESKNLKTVGQAIDLIYKIVNEN